MGRTCARMLDARKLEAMTTTQWNWTLVLPLVLMTGIAVAEPEAPIVHLPALAANPKIELPPEIAVKLLVNSYKWNQLEPMSDWIVGAQNSESLKQINQEFAKSKGDNRLFLSDLHLEINGDDAIVTAQLTLRDGLFDTLTQSQRLELKREGEHWKIVPDNVESFFADKTQGFLLNLATAIAFPDVMLSRKETAACLLKAKTIAMGWQQYQQDYEDEDKIKVTAATFQAELMPYIKDEQVFHCAPDQKEQSSFALNPNLSGLAWAKIARAPMIKIGPTGEIQFDPIDVELFDVSNRAAWTVETDSLVLFYEGHNQQLSFLHHGYAIVCLVNGHVQLVNEQQARNLRWKP